MGSGLEALRKVCMGFWPSFGTREATPHPPGRPWWYLWGQGWVWGHLGWSWGCLWGQGWVWGHLGLLMPYGVILGVFMGSGLGLVTPGVILCPMGWSWGCLWGQGWVWGHLGSSHALWGDPSGVYGVRVAFGDIWVGWKHQKNFRKACMGFWPSFGTSGAMWGHPTPSRPTLVVFMGSG